ncbi:MAG TPA: nascent polypeptide-associated complex protein [Candidatus Diapherotrites archaeon]|uniref:Nascent polypeptide-associated complex protein n=1 Tax=Candidatus Iainarchaeum sp. TaxID=3101447 RepID=A0A7J4JJN0_9ARCH|nr:nascent polypeptide-associated complex protein [Candidatus Diapherotrites archaeon]HIH16555.1 nascent polypeptide-associated complex protein [Candidatus Diapherotrites archaeon]
MFPGMGNMNPRDMQRVMKQLGMKTEEINAKRVVFELEGKRLVVDSPSVTAIEMGGQKTYTVVGTAREEAGPVGAPEEDVKLVMEQAGCSKKEAETALKASGGDLAEAIAKLKG